MKTMPLPTTKIKTAISFGLSTLRRIIISGRESAITLIMKAKTVPSAAPLPSNASTTGTMPAALEYMGMPTATAPGTDHTRARVPVLVAGAGAGPLGPCVLADVGATVAAHLGLPRPPHGRNLL